MVLCRVRQHLGHTAKRRNARRRKGLKVTGFAAAPLFSHPQMVHHRCGGVAQGYDRTGDRSADWGQDRLNFSQGIRPTRNGSGFPSRVSLRFFAVFPSNVQGSRSPSALRDVRTASREVLESLREHV